MAKPKYPHLLIRSSAIHAAGCYTLDPVAKGRRICEYDGPRMPKDIADTRYADRVVTYLFGVGEGDTVIDGFGAAMFMNHCCSPNCETEEIDGRIFVTAIKDIPAGSELTYEYHLYDSDDATQDCYCGAPNCRKTMFAEAEVARREALAAKAARKNARASRAA